MSDFVQKHFVSATNVSQFAQPKKHHGQQCVLVCQGLKEKQNCVYESFISKCYFSESNFCTITSHFVNPISKMFCNVLLQLIEYGKT